MAFITEISETCLKFSKLCSIIPLTKSVETLTIAYTLITSKILKYVINALSINAVLFFDQSL